MYRMYRIYLKWPESRVSNKTVTPSPPIAEAAFRELLRRQDLIGKKCAAVLSLNNRQLEYCRFDYPADYQNGLKKPDAEIKLFHEN